MLVACLLVSMLATACSVIPPALPPLQCSLSASSRAGESDPLQVYPKGRDAAFGKDGGVNLSHVVRVMGSPFDKTGGIPPPPSILEINGLDNVLTAKSRYQRA